MKSTLDYESPLMKAANEFAGSESSEPSVKEKLAELNCRYIPVIQTIITEGIQNKEFKPLDISDITTVIYGFLAGVGAICQIVNCSDQIKIHKLAVEIVLNGLST